MSKSAFRLALAALLIACVRGNNCVKILLGNEAFPAPSNEGFPIPKDAHQVEGPVPDRIKDHKVVFMAIGVKQQNVQKLEDFLMASADTTKPTYGKHMSNDEVQALTHPSEPHLAAVHKWLASAHAKVLPLTSSNQDMIVATVSLDGAAHLFNTRYHLFVAQDKGQEVGDFFVGSRSNFICVREEVNNAVDYINHAIVNKADVPTDALHRLPPPIDRSDEGAKEASEEEQANTPSADDPQGIQIVMDNPKATVNTLVNNPQTIRPLYNMPLDEFGDWKTKVAVTVDSGAQVSNYLLGFYWNAYCSGPIDCGAEPKTESNPLGLPKTVPAQGSASFPFPQSYRDPWSPGLIGAQGESQMDIEAITATATGIHTEFWTNLGNTGAAEGDRLPPSYGYQLGWGPVEFFLRVSNTSDIDVPKVFSNSFSLNNNYATPRVLRRMDVDFMKLGARGITYLSASGDNGAVGGTGGSNMCPGGKFSANAESSLPHVTSVGGTQPYAELNPRPGFGFPRPGPASEQSWVYPPYFEGTALYAKLPEGSGSSAGGFGTVFEQPAYQKVAVDKYLQKVADAGEFPPKSRGYNTSKRAFPDISAQAKNYCFNAPTSSQMLPASCSSTECLKAAMQTYRCGKGGTSAAAPTLAGIIGQLNAARAKAGKGTLGFLNLLIYQHPEVFNDITQGVPSVACAEHGAGPKKGEPLLDKKSCDKECQDTVVLGKGWPVKEGYDMATGVGTPDYKKLKKLVLSLPGWLP